MRRLRVPMKAQQQIQELLDKLVAEGEAVPKTKFQPRGNWVSGPPTYVDLAGFTRWRARCKLLISLLDRAGRPWEGELTADWNNRIEQAIKTQSTLQAIKLSVAEGVLLQLEDLVLADAFANLLEQAKYLLGQGYFLASGVILRAVLEERLRRLSDRHGLTLSKPKPTLSDYNTELYRAGVYGKVTFKDVESLVAVGNAAAHKDTGITFQQNVSIQFCFLLCWVDGTSIQAPEAGSDRRGENPSRSASPVANRRFPRRPAGADSVALPCR